MRRPIGMGIAEIGEPLVVDARHLAGGFVVVDPAGGAENAVQYLGLDAVAVLVFDPQFGVRHATDALLAVLVDPLRGHAVGAMDLARLVEAAGRAHAVPHIAFRSAEQRDREFADSPLEGDGFELPVPVSETVKTMTDTRLAC